MDKLMKKPPSIIEIKDTCLKETFPKQTYKSIKGMMKYVPMDKSSKEAVWKFVENNQDKFLIWCFYDNVVGDMTSVCVVGCKDDKTLKNMKETVGDWAIFEPDGTVKIRNRD